MTEEVYLKYVKSKQLDLHFFYLAYKDMGEEAAVKTEKEFNRDFPFFFNAIDKNLLIDNIMSYYNRKYEINSILTMDKQTIGYFK